MSYQKIYRINTVVFKF